MENVVGATSDATSWSAASSCAAWRRLAEHKKGWKRSLRQLFADSPGRADELTYEVADLTIDMSKHLIDTTTVELLVELAHDRRLDAQRHAMFSGDKINVTENRSVLHTALRASEPLIVDGVDVCQQVRNVLQRMGDAADRLRSGSWIGSDGSPITTVVNIGIGGSDLGPRMATRALQHLVPKNLDVRYVSNVDGADLAITLADLNPASTLFVIASKTFTTVETMANAKSARRWLLASLKDQSAIARHFVAVSTNSQAVTQFGIDPANMFEFWDWVGGRYSVDSAVGFSLMCGIGPVHFAEFLEGMRRVDNYFRMTPVTANAVVLSALIGIWYRNFWGWPTHATIPYSQALDRFPSFLQQLDMESNGKRIGRDGEPVDYQTGPVVWGEPGTNGQHAFFQLLHQGTTPVPCDFIGFFEPEPHQVSGIDMVEHHRLLFANMIAQSKALAFGRTQAELRGEPTDAALVLHRTFPGNRPSTTICAPALSASTLGQLIAFFEHRVFVQGAIWGINSFDQWGVELGKVLATRIADDLDHSPVGNSQAETSEMTQPQVHDSSTASLIARYRQHRGFRTLADL